MVDSKYAKNTLKIQHNNNKKEGKRRRKNKNLD